METTNKQEVVHIADEGISLEKNSRGYNYKIKVAGLDIGKLERLNVLMQEKYGTGIKNLDEDEK